MAKVSRPIIYLLVAGAVVYAAVILTEPDAPAHKHTSTTKKSSRAVEGGFTEADYTAHFARYAKPSHDAFSPEIAPKKSNAASAPDKTKVGLVTSVGWALTGISAINGVQSALVENSATRDSVFLKVGDTWNGLRVVAIRPDAVELMNSQGQKTRLTFAETPPASGTNPGQSAVNPGASGIASPGAAAIAPAPQTGRGGRLN